VICLKFDLSHIEFNHYDIKRGINLPQQPSEELAELVGIVLGDGNMHKTENCITITGSLEDYYYYNLTVIPIIKKLFNIIPFLKRRKDRNSYYLFFNSQAIMSFLHETLNMCRGNKINARIPNFVYSDTKFIQSLLRGLFDTDGCLKFSKQTKNIHYYPRVEIGFKQSNLIFEIKELIKSLNINYSSWKENQTNPFVKFQISGINNLEKWMRFVVPNNPVHKTKYFFWKKFGYYIPNSSLSYRVKSLNLNMNNLSHDLSSLMNSPVEE